MGLLPWGGLHLRAYWNWPVSIWGLEQGGEAIECDKECKLWGQTDLNSLN